jgi:hypothetical protein
MTHRVNVGRIGMMIVVRCKLAVSIQPCSTITTAVTTFASRHYR